jgi:hypothetical protein
VSAPVGTCLGCKARWLMSVVGRNQGGAPLCPRCRARIEVVPVVWADEEPTATGRVVEVQTRILREVSRVAS